MKWDTRRFDIGSQFPIWDMRRLKARHKKQTALKLAGAVLFMALLTEAIFLALVRLAGV